VRTEEPRLRRRYLARHPDSELYVGFRDFGFFHVQIERAHLVAGFGKIHWIAADDVLLRQDVSALAEAEAEIVAHMNEDHADAIAAYARGLGGLEGDGWQMTGIDPDGCDLRSGSAYWRLAFERPVTDVEAARAELVRLVKEARAQLSSGTRVPDPREGRRKDRS
jgi:heme iron utilization protein